MKFQGGAAMLKAITHFDQVPLGVVIEIMERQIHEKAAAQTAQRMSAISGSSFAAKRVNNERGYTMKAHTPIDIFRVDPKGVLWLESLGSVDEAKARIQLLAAQDPGEYVVLNQTTGTKLTIKINSMIPASGC
jgi:hypothetical protein